MTRCGWGSCPAGKRKQLNPITISKWAGEGSEPPASLKATGLQRADNTSPAEMLSGLPVFCAPLFLESRWLEMLPEQSSGFTARGLAPIGAIPLTGTQRGKAGLGLGAAFPGVGQPVQFLCLEQR